MERIHEEAPSSSGSYPGIGKERTPDMGSIFWTEEEKKLPFIFQERYLGDGVKVSARFDKETNTLLFSCSNGFKSSMSMPPPGKLEIESIFSTVKQICENYGKEKAILH